jgi:hypothetical protein
MKCSNPDCNRGIGLVSHRRGWFDMGWVLDGIGRTIARYLDWAEGDNPFTSSDPKALRASLKAGDVLLVEATTIFPASSSTSRSRPGRMPRSMSGRSRAPRPAMASRTS